MNATIAGPGIRTGIHPFRTCHNRMARLLPCVLLAAAAEACGSDSTPVTPAAAPAAPGGQAVVAGTAGPGTIVTLEPIPPREFPAPSEPRVMDQFGQQFLPGLLVAQVGQRVEFRSSEDVLHNVRVDEAGTRAPVFNVATPPFESYSHTFDRPGYYNVSCDVHPAMRANILVAATPYSAVADEKGAFSIAGVEPGSYTARAFSGATPTERALEVVAPRTELPLAGR
jgi:plastocyanin